VAVVVVALQSHIVFSAICGRFGRREEDVSRFMVSPGGPRDEKGGGVPKKGSRNGNIRIRGKKEPKHVFLYHGAPVPVPRSPWSSVLYSGLNHE
jgi:hypothetical protein